MNPLPRLLVSFALLFNCATTIPAQQRPLDRDFLDAVEKRDFARVKDLLNKGADVNAKEPINGHFALQYAINWPDASLVKLLLERGANVNAVDNIGNTALTDAADESGPEYTAIVKLLIERGADIHAANNAALFGAVRNGNSEVVRLLIAKGAPVNAREAHRQGDTVLLAAASGSSVQTLDLLLAAGADIRATNHAAATALMKAVTLEHHRSTEKRLPMIELLLGKGSDINARDNNGRTALLYSVAQHMSEAGGVTSRPEVVRLLLDRGADVQARDFEGNTALLLTVDAWQGPIEIVRLLLDKGIDVNAQNRKGISALMIAAEEGKLDVVKLLFSKGVDLNRKDQEGATALDHAVGAGQADIAKLLLAQGGKSRNQYKSDTDVIAATTNFALLRAAASNNLAEVKAKLALGANVNSRNSRGETPLMMAAQSGYSGIEVLTLLIEKGADLNITNIDGETALMLAVKRNNREAANVLLANKAAVYPRNKQQQTALHIASAGLRAQIVKGLLERRSEITVGASGVDVRGVELDARDAEGRTPLMLAADNEGLVPDEVMELLLNKGAQLNAQDNQGNSALMIAAKAGSMSGVQFLLSKGADVNLKNNAGQTALKLARLLHENRRISNVDLVESRIVALLVKAGARE